MGRRKKGHKMLSLFNQPIITAVSARDAPPSSTMATSAPLCAQSPPLRPTRLHYLPLQRLHHSCPSGGRTTSHQLVGFRPHRVDRRRSARKKLFLPVQCKVESIVEGEFGDKVLRSDVPVLVEFVADWCGPCRLVAPAVEWASQEYKEKLKIVKIDHDSNPKLIEEYKVYGLPALILFRNGQEVPESRREGAITKVKLKEYLDTQLEVINARWIS